MGRQDLDKALLEMRSAEPPATAIREAARRVSSDLFDAAYVPERLARLRGCPDFQALLPQYRKGTLSPARQELVKDHLATCVECRRAFRSPAHDESASRTIPQIHSRRPLFAWALAATLATGAVLGFTGVFRGLLPGQGGVTATVVSIKGALYRVNEFSSSLVTVGSIIGNAEQLRTAKGSSAIFKMADGALVEMGERSDVSMNRSWRDTSLDIDRGRVIVQPPSNSVPSFLVSAGDLHIPVRNAVFAVDRGTKGARVAVAKGSTSFEHSGHRYELQAGDQFAGNYRLQKVSLESEFAWSQNADQYRALLGELSTLQKQWGTIPPQGLRYSSDLAPYLPANTIFYAAIPNVGNTLTEAKRMFDERLAESEVLRQWWQQQPAAKNGQLDHAFEQIASVSQYLGGEIVCAITLSGPKHYGQPLFLADLSKPGLEEYLKQTVPGGLGKNTVVVVKNIVLASPDAQAVQTAAQAVANGAPAGFTQTPFYNRIEQSYSTGAGYLLAVNMEQIVGASVNNPKEIPPGFNNAQYLVLEKRDLAADNTETRAALSFAGARQGIPSWLGSPGPMGSLDFISPNAQLAFSAIMKNPKTIVQELISYASQNDAASAQHLADLQSHLGVNLIDDLAAPFGSDATLAIDGNLLPVPAWRFVAEVYNFDLLRQSIKTLVEHANAQANENSGQLRLASEQINGFTIYSLHNTKFASVAAYYTYVDGYLIAAPDAAGVLQAIQNHRNGNTLVSSATFQSQMPADGYNNFSALLWHNAGKSLAGLADQLKKSGPLASVLAGSSGPGLICVYGEQDRIIAAGKGGFLGFNLGTLAGLGEGKSIPAVMASRNNKL